MRPRGPPSFVGAGSVDAVPRSADVGRRDAAVKPKGMYSRRPAGRGTASAPGTRRMNATKAPFESLRANGVAVVGENAE
jgi:hypothetical protein